MFNLVIMFIPPLAVLCFFCPLYVIDASFQYNRLPCGEPAAVREGKPRTVYLQPEQGGMMVATIVPKGCHRLSTYLVD